MPPPHPQPLTHEHAHLDHGHEYPLTEHEPVISQQWKWLTVAGNAAIGACELATGNVSTLSVTADGLHNLGDTATYYMQAENVLNAGFSEAKRTGLRKAAHWIIAVTSLAVSAKAGADLALDHESAPNALTMYAAGASLALNGLLLARLRAGLRRKRAAGAGTESVHERDLSKHFWAVDMPSAGLAVAGAVLQRYNVDIEQAAAVASGLVGAYAFRPTKANLAHDHSEHEPVAVPSHSREPEYAALPPIHPWTYHPRNYRRDVLRQIRQNGERPGLVTSARAVGQLLLWSIGLAAGPEDSLHRAAN